MMSPFSQNLRSRNPKFMLLAPLQDISKEIYLVSKYGRVYQARWREVSTRSVCLLSIVCPDDFWLTSFSFSSDSLDTGTVQVIVGDKEKVSTIHKGVLCNVAPFFRVAIEGQFLEGIEQVLRLPEDNPTLFQYFQLWVYTKAHR